MLSKKPLIRHVRKRIQVDYPVELLRLRTALVPLRPAPTSLACSHRNPDALAHVPWNTGSITGSSLDFTTICAIRSDTVGIPNCLSPPFAFGIFTVRTGGGK